MNAISRLRPPRLAPSPRGDVASCPACGSSRIRRRLIGRGDEPIDQCAACGLRWLVEPPIGDALAALYGSGAYDPAGSRLGVFARVLHLVNNRVRLRELRGLRRGRLLDVGSGKGHFLAAARDRGWQVTGVEFAAAAVAEARHRYGLDIIAGDFADAPPEGGFDVVTMWHVLEHLPDPGVAVDRARSLLQPDGHLVVSVPNAASVQARIAGDAWMHLDLPRHIYHFTPAALAATLKRHGFVVVRISYLYPELELLGFIQSGLNMAGAGQDELYRYMKGDRTITLGPRLTATALAAMALVPSAVAWTLAAPVVRSGASIQVLARRA